MSKNLTLLEYAGTLLAWPADLHPRSVRADATDAAAGIEAGRAAGARVAALKGLPGDINIEITCLADLAGFLSGNRGRRKKP